jgi:hypothetical protein
VGVAWWGEVKARCEYFVSSRDFFIELEVLQKPNAEDTFSVWYLYFPSSFDDNAVPRVFSRKSGSDWTTSSKNCLGVAFQKGLYTSLRI